ncbi:MAG: GDSL-type esterase/lipase family protein [Opitutales bacterium]
MRLLRLSFLCAAVLASSFAPAFELSLDASGKGVVIKGNQPAEVVRYTLNGKDPDFSAGVCLAPIELPEGGTVKAAAFEGNKRVGEVRTQVVPGPGPKNTALVPLTQNRDWKSYDWVTRHHEILALNQPGAMRADVVFLGDSITHFWSGEPKAKRVAGKDSWEKWIAPHHPINLGYGWDRTENVLWRLRHGEIAGLKPKAFVVLIGTNNLSGFNTPAETAEGVAEVCRELRRQAPQAKILLLAILPRQAKPDATRQRVTDTNKLLQGHMLLKSQGPQIADAYLDLTDKLVEADGSILKETMNDYLHPTNKGYEVMGAAIDAQLKAWSL